MSEKKEEAVKAAEAYVNKQLAVMKKDGSATALSAEAYNALVQQVVEATAFRFRG